MSVTTVLEVVETGEVVHLMTTEEASSVTTQIVVKLDAIADNYQSVMPLIRDAITRQAHAALGYLSPGAYVADRFGSALSRLGADLRRQVVRELSEAGLSTRAIAPVVGVSQKTVVKDRQVIPGVSPDPTVTAELDLIVDDEAATENDWPTAENEWPVDEWPDDDEPLSQADCEALDRELSDAELASEAEAVETVVKPRVIGIDGKSYPQPPKPAPLTEAERIARRDEQEHKGALRRQLGAIMAFLDGWDCASTLRISAWREEILAAMTDFDRTRFLAIERQLP